MFLSIIIQNSDLASYVLPGFQFAAGQRPGQISSGESESLACVIMYRYKMKLIMSRLSEILYLEYPLLESQNIKNLSKDKNGGVPVCSGTNSSGDLMGSRLGSF